MKSKPELMLRKDEAAASENVLAQSCYRTIMSSEKVFLKTFGMDDALIESDHLKVLIYLQIMFVCHQY